MTLISIDIIFSKTHHIFGIPDYCLWIYKIKQCNVCIIVIRFYMSTLRKAVVKCLTIIIDYFHQ